MEFTRLLTAMVTPYDENLEVDYAKAADIAEYLYKNGSEGLIVSGTTGESPVLSDEEKIQLFKTVKERVGNKVQIWAGAGSNDTRHSIVLCREAEKSGADGVMVVTPYYNKPSQEGLYQHFKQIADRVSLPVMLYNVPSRTSVNLLPDTVRRLAEIENIVALKEASGDMDQMSLVSGLVNDKFVIYSGDDSLTLPMMALGASGVVSVASHVAGLQIKQMIDAFLVGNIAEARSCHQKLFPIFKGLFIVTSPAPVKEALNLMGLNVGGLRSPLVNVGANEKAIIKDLLVRYNYI